MTWKIELGRRAARAFKRIPHPDQHRLASALRGMRDNTFYGDIKRLKGQHPGYRRLHRGKPAPDLNMHGSTFAFFARGGNTSDILIEHCAWMQDIRNLGPNPVEGYSSQTAAAQEA